MLTLHIFRLLLHKHFRTFTKATITCTSPSTMSGVPDYSYNFIDGVAVPHESLTDPSRAGKYHGYLVYSIRSQRLQVSKKTPSKSISGHFDNGSLWVISRVRLFVSFFSSQNIRLQVLVPSNAGLSPNSTRLLSRRVTCNLGTVFYSQWRTFELSAIIGIIITPSNKNGSI